MGTALMGNWLPILQFNFEMVQHKDFIQLYIQFQFHIYSDKELDAVWSLTNQT